MSTQDQSQIRLIRANNNLYLRKEDVVEYIRNMAATEETDCRNRLEEAAANIQRMV